MENPELHKYLTVQENVTETAQKGGKVLGIIWNEADELVIDIESYVNGVEKVLLTKRNILKVIASIFDIAGFIQLLVVKLKFLFQSICVSGLGWDDKINEEMTLKWFRVVQEFRDTKEVIFLAAIV